MNGAEDFEKHALNTFGHDISADIVSSPSETGQRVVTEEEDKDEDMKRGRARGESQPTIVLSNFYIKHKHLSQQFGHMQMKQQKTRMPRKNEEEDIESDEETQEEQFLEQVPDDVENKSIDKIMIDLSLNHSISKIGKSPLANSDIKQHAHDSQYLQIMNENQISPTKAKMRRHHQKSFKQVNKTQAMLRQEYLDHLEASSKLSVTALQNFIKENHPKKIDEATGEAKNWSICEEIGSLVQFGCCVKRKIPKVSRNMGLGASLYLLSLKSYVRLFFALSLLSIPSAIVLSSGN